MSFNLGVMSAAVTLDVSQYKRNLSTLENESGKTFSRVAKASAGFFTARALFGFVNSSMLEFSKFEEGNNKLKYTFTEVREEAERTAKQIAEIYNLSPQVAINAISDIGDMLTGFGFAQAQALDFAKQITERGIDIASFKGLDQTETIRRMTAALTGETDSLKMMGVVIRQDTSEFRNNIKTIQETTAATEAQAKAQAILAQIIEQTKNAEGDYLRPDAPRTYAQELTDLREAVKKFKLEIGTQIQPIAQDAIVRARELLGWYNKLNPAIQATLTSVIAFSGGLTLLSKTGALAKINLKIEDTLKLLDMNYRAAAASATAGAASQNLFSLSIKNVKSSIISLKTALGPAGLAILAIGTAYSGITYLTNRQTEAFEKQSKAAEEATEKAKSLYYEHTKENEKSISAIKRLEELSNYERINNSEKEEAKILISQLTEKYEDLGIAIDQTTGKIIVHDNTMEKIKKQQSKQLIKDARNINQELLNQFDTQYNILKQKSQSKASVLAIELSFLEQKTQFENIDKKIEEYEKLISKVNKSKYLFHDDQIEDLKNLILLLKSIKDYKYTEKVNTPEGQKKLSKLQEQSKKIREITQEIDETEWDIKFNASDVETRAKMLSYKIQQIFEKQSGKYNSIEAFKYADRNTMTEQELKDLQEIIKLEEQRRLIRKESADAFSAEHESYAYYLENLEKQRREKAVDKEIEAARQAGDLISVDANMQREFVKARDAANAMKREYERALHDAEADNIFTEEEKKRISELRRNLEEANATAEKYAIDKISSSEDQMQEARANSEAVGAFNSKILASLFGQTAPAEETAKNTRKTVEYLRELLISQENSTTMRYT